jgi:DHA1 family multidrug resistance protein-like MFS transporter
MNLVNGSGPLGSLVGALLGGYVVSEFGVHWLFGLDAIIAAVIAVVLTLGYRETFVTKPTPHILVMLAEAVRAVIHSPVAVTIFLISFIYNCAFVFSYTYLPVRIGELVGEQAAPVSIGLIQGIAGAATLVGSVLWGAVADRLGHRRLLSLLLLSILILWLPMYNAQTFPQLAITWAAFNAVNPSAGSMMITIVSLNIPSEKRGAILSMIYLPLNFAFVIGPTLAAFVAKGFEVRDVFLASAVLSLAALAAFVTVVGRTREEASVIAE